MTDGPRRIRLDLAYDGTGFAGWQLQPGERTVQGVIEEALSRLENGALARVRGAGRTDAGVHARGQVADAEVSVALDDARLLRALRSMLPRDVRPVNVTTADPSFHARHDAVSKTYRYFLDRSPHGDPFVARYALHHPHPMDLAAVADALRRLPGRRDWSGFAGAACPPGDRIRHLARASCLEVSPDLLAFEFTADGFLNHMVRNLVGTIVEIARGRFRAERVDEILASGERTLAGPTAPPHGLCLERVAYRGEGLG
ncbi:MAG: tRNA pseudouridine(38-40) synthase TruA [Acidobacteriia bacterium]|nr:tRNA pseudouridine(38-40) synthase TruA [Terriglobia bacterium]